MSVPRFVISSPGHATIYDYEALALHKNHLLRLVTRGTRRGVAGLPPELVRLNPAVGLATFLSATALPQFHAESFRFRLYPWFDRWAKKLLRPGDHIISSYAYANESFKWVRANGGLTFMDAGNSHPENFWTTLVEEHERWGSRFPPVARHYYERSLAMMEHVDYVLSASSFVARTFLERGFKPERILPHPRPVDLSAFKPPERARPPNRPLTVIGTGALCLRKGSPYLFEAFRLIQKSIPTARFVLRRIIGSDVQPLLSRYRDLPITWLERTSPAGLAEHLRQADIFILPSLEDGLALTVVEALACGLPVITTPNTGASELITPGVNGEIVPIRDPKAIAEGVFAWAERILAPDWRPKVLIDPCLLSFEHFERVFLGQLRELKLA